MISIRISNEEYEGLRSLCVSQRARSVSDLARTAMNQLLSMTSEAINSGPSVELRLQEIHGRINLLDRRIEQLTERLEGDQ
jgi:Arc/MetJ-type ribon-helix-helix transcriptional regulator